MKKLITITAILFSISATAQKDTTGYTATFTVSELVGFINAIDQNIDSKKTSRDIIDYLMKHAKPIVADKPKK